MRRLFRLALLTMVLLLVSLVSALTAMRFAIHGREVRTPNLVGLSLPKAGGALTEMGLLMETGDSFYSQNIPEGSVVSQTPAAGTKVRRGWRVRVAVSLGASRASVPDVVGQSGRAGEINVRRRGLEEEEVQGIKLAMLDVVRRAVAGAGCEDASRHKESAGFQVHHTTSRAGCRGFSSGGTQAAPKTRHHRAGRGASAGDARFHRQVCCRGGARHRAGGAAAGQPRQRS